MTLSWWLQIKLVQGKFILTKKNIFFGCVNFPPKNYLFPQMLFKFALSGKYYLRFFPAEFGKMDNDFLVEKYKKKLKYTPLNVLLVL